MGRIAVAEVLCVHPDIRQMIHDKASSVALRNRAMELGMLDLRGSCLLALAQGVTSVQELMRTIPAEDLLAVD